MVSARIACLTSSAAVSLRDLALAFSPRVEVGDSLVYLDVGAGDAQAWGNSLLEQLPPKTSFRLGIARNKLLARLAAHYGKNNFTLLRPEAEKNFLSLLPLEVLSPAEALIDTLHRWGIRTLSAFAQLPAKQILRHLGKEGWALYQEAQGLDGEPLAPTPRPVLFLEKIDLDWPIAELEPFNYYAEALLTRLSAQLLQTGLACQTLEVVLRLESKKEETHLIRLRTPTRDVKTLQQLLHLQLASHPPQAAVTGFCLRALPDAPQKAQLTLFGPPALSPMQLSTLLAQLTVLVGIDRVGSPQTVNAHRPERFAMRLFQPPPAPLFPEPIKEHRALWTVRVLRPARPLHVILSQQKPQTPVRVQALTEPRKMTGDVKQVAGPWHLEEEWWATNATARDYWDVELDNGGLYRIFRDRHRNRWFVDGIYD